MITHFLDLQVVSDSKQIPSLDKFQTWMAAALFELDSPHEIVLRIVDEPEMTDLNGTYRKKSGPTNILSFPFELPEEIPIKSDLLGDLVACAPVIEKEAREQQKQLEHHWAHIFIHGVLHLLGYDHLDDTEAEEMEAIEIRILSNLNINNPYQEYLGS